MRVSLDHTHLNEKKRKGKGGDKEKGLETSVAEYCHMIVDDSGWHFIMPQCTFVGVM